MTTPEDRAMAAPPYAKMVEGAAAAADVRSAIFRYIVGYDCQIVETAHDVADRAAVAVAATFHHLASPTLHGQPVKEGGHREWLDPTSEMLGDPLFDAIWAVIKRWDISVPHAYEGYCGATGNHVRAIYDAVKALSATPALHGQPAVGEGHGKPCFFCGKPCSDLAGNPSQWSLGFAHPDKTGICRWHHVGCVVSRLFSPPSEAGDAGEVEAVARAEAIEEAAQIAEAYPSLWEEPDCAARDIRKLASAEIAGGIRGLSHTGGGKEQSNG